MGLNWVRFQERMRSTLRSATFRDTEATFGCWLLRTGRRLPTPERPLRCTLGSWGISLSFADNLIGTPQREKAGATGLERYDYQALWGLALIFERHGVSDDYAIAFEFHDDLMLLDSASAPLEARFYQVKTNDKGPWSLAALTHRLPKRGEEGGKLPSHIGNLFSNYINFPTETRSLNFVSNAPVSLVDSASGIHALETCSAEDFSKFLKKLQEEHPSATDATAKLIHFVRTDLSLHDASTHLKGKLGDFVTDVVGSIEYNPDTLYKTIVEECRSRSKYTGAINSFEDLIRHKSITRAQVEEWLDVVRQRQRAPEWSDVSQDLGLSGVEAIAVRREWTLYRAAVLNPADEGGNRVRAAIRVAIGHHASSPLSMAGLLQALVSQTQAIAQSNMTPFTTARLRAMILYELYRDDQAGNVQAADPKPQDQKS